MPDIIVNIHVYSQCKSHIYGSFTVEECKRKTKTKRQ